MPFKGETPSPFTHSNVEVIGVFRAPTISSIDSDATIDDQPGAGRTLGRFIAWLGSKLEKAANNRAKKLGLGPKAIADEICRLAGHREIYIINKRRSWITDRDLCLPVASGRGFNKSQREALKTLCQKLIGHARSHILENQLAALEGIVLLAVKDPRIRAILADCNLDRILTRYDEPDLILATVRAFGAVEFSGVHRVWSRILSFCIMKQGGDYQRMGMDACMNDSSFRNNALETLGSASTSFLAARYYKSSIHEYSKTFELYPPESCPLKVFLHKAVERYCELAKQQQDSVEWSTFRSCIHFESGWRSKPYIFVDQFVMLAGNLEIDVFIRYFSSTLITMFPVERVRGFRDLSEDNRGGYYTVIKPLYEILSVLTGSRSYDVHLSCRDRIDSVSGRSLKGSIFFDKIIFTYHILICHTFQTDHGFDFHLTVGNTLKDMCMPLVSYMTSNCPDERSLALTLAVRFCAISKYCKRAMLQIVQGISMELHSTISQSLTSAVVESDENISTLRYYTWNFPFSGYDFYRVFDLQTGEFYIIQKYICGITSARSIRSYFGLHQNDIICVHELEIYHQDILFICVVCNEEPFCAEKHHAVLAYQSNEEPSRKYYVARVSDCYTHVEDGASFVQYREKLNNGRWDDPKTTSEFQVLVLRHDPEDYRRVKTEGELMDRTGPLGWRNASFEEEED